MCLSVYLSIRSSIFLSLFTFTLFTVWRNWPEPKENRVPLKTFFLHLLQVNLLPMSMSVYFYLCSFVPLSIFISVGLFLSLFTFTLFTWNLSICPLSICLYSVYISICTSILMSIYLPKCISSSVLSLRLSICPSVYMSVCPSVYLPICLSVLLSICPCCNFFYVFVGTVNVLLTNPLWVVNLRLKMQKGEKSKKSYSGLIGTILTYPNLSLQCLTFPYLN